ncbi:MBL fold metallo-hydrolase [Candidatus Pelagibacter sp.]|nr:MBL fold metallo-hydrolase [Candidatus Pelagibacter sp.]
MKFIILGCGSSMGVPKADGSFGNCDPKNFKNYRSRCSALIKSKDRNILIDTSPDLRLQMLKNRVTNLDSVIYTHHHADQTHGVNDLRVFFLKKKDKIPVYADEKTKKYLLNSFSYCFKKSKDYPPILKLVNVKKKFSLGKFIEIESVRVRHGSIDSLSYIINKRIAYLPDANEIYKTDYKKFLKLDYLIIDCLRYKKHPSHFNLNDVLKLNISLKPKKIILTNLHSDLDYKELINILPKNIKPAYDGLTLNFLDEKR